MQGLFLRLRTWWETADRTQKTVTIFGSLFLVLLIGGTFYFASKPKMDVLFRELSPQDQGMVANELTKLGVPFEQDRAGAIRVPIDRIAEVQGKLALAQKMPSTGHVGYDGLKDMGIMNTPTVERERLRTMLEGELAKSIESIEGVSSARVHLTLGETSPFAREANTASASVIVSEQGAGSVSGQSARAIQHLVQYAVNGLNPKNITVISSQGKTLLDGADAEGGSAADKIQAESSEARRREVALQSLLDNAFGRGNTVVSIPVLELNFDQRDERRNEVLPTKPLTIETNTEKMGSGVASVGGAAGTASNTPGGAATPATPDANAKGYEGEQQSKTMATTETHTTTVYAPGALKRMAINVLVNSTNITNSADVKKVIDGELGPLVKDTANFGTTVTAVAFDTKAKDEQTKADAAAASSAKMQQMLSILPIAALLVVGFMVVKAIKKTAGAGNVLVAATPGGQVIPLGSGDVTKALGHSEMHHLPTIVNEHGEKVALPPGATVNAEGKVVGEDGQPIASLKAQDFVKTNAAALALSEMADEQQQHVRIGSIPDRINIPLEQIKKMAEERPQTVAMLLKTWLLSDK